MLLLYFNAKYQNNILLQNFTGTIFPLGYIKCGTEFLK